VLETTLIQQIEAIAKEVDITLFEQKQTLESHSDDTSEKKDILLLENFYSNTTSLFPKISQIQTGFEKVQWKNKESRKNAEMDLNTTIMNISVHSINLLKIMAHKIFIFTNKHAIGYKNMEISIGAAKEKITRAINLFNYYQNNLLPHYSELQQELVDMRVQIEDLHGKFVDDKKIIPLSILNSLIKQGLDETSTTGKETIFDELMAVVTKKQSLPYQFIIFVSRAETNSFIHINKREPSEMVKEIATLANQKIKYYTLAHLTYKNMNSNQQQHTLMVNYKKRLDESITMFIQHYVGMLAYHEINLQKDNLITLKNSLDRLLQINPNDPTVISLLKNVSARICTVEDKIIKANIKNQEDLAHANLLLQLTTDYNQKFNELVTQFETEQSTVLKKPATATQPIQLESNDDEQEVPVVITIQPAPNKDPEIIQVENIIYQAEKLRVSSEKDLKLIRNKKLLLQVDFQSIIQNLHTAIKLLFDAEEIILTDTNKFAHLHDPVNLLIEYTSKVIADSLKHQQLLFERLRKSRDQAKTYIINKYGYDAWYKNSKTSVSLKAELLSKVKTNLQQLTGLEERFAKLRVQQLIMPTTQSDNKALQDNAPTAPRNNTNSAVALSLSIAIMQEHFSSICLPLYSSPAMPHLTKDKIRSDLLATGLFSNKKLTRSQSYESLQDPLENWTDFLHRKNNLLSFV